MKVRTLAAAALLVLPVDAFAQMRVGLPRPKNPFPTITREVPAAARATRLLRSRWSTEAYSLVGYAPGGRLASAGPSFGNGALHAFRATERLWMTIDLTGAGFLQGSNSWTTTELGVRYGPPIVGQYVRPFVDARAFYMSSYSQGQLPDQPGTAPPNHLSRGGGLLLGAGSEVAVSRSWAFTAQAAASRQLLRVVSTGRSEQIEPGMLHWSTHYRLQIGLRYNRARVMSLVQNPGM